MRVGCAQQQHRTARCVVWVASRVSSEQVCCRPSGKVHSACEELIDDLGAFDSQSVHVLLANFDQARPISRPPRNCSVQGIHLVHPIAISLRQVPRTDDEDVDVTVRTAIASRCGSKKRRVNRLQPPTLNRASQRVDQHSAKVRKLPHRIGRQMAAVEGVEQRATTALLEHQTLFYEPIKHALGTGVRATGTPSDLSAARRAFGTTQHGQDRAVHCWEQPFVWLGKVDSARMAVIRPACNIFLPLGNKCCQGLPLSSAPARSRAPRTARS